MKFPFKIDSVGPGVFAAFVSSGWGWSYSYYPPTLCYARSCSCYTFLCPLVSSRAHWQRFAPCSNLRSLSASDENHYDNSVEQKLQSRPPSRRLGLHSAFKIEDQTNNSSECSESYWSERVVKETLTSTSGKTVKLFKSLLSSGRRRKRDELTVLEGHRLVVDVLSHPRTSTLIRHVVLSKEALYHPTFGRRLEDALRKRGKTQCFGLDSEDDDNDFRISFATEEVVNACCDTVTPQGVAALCSIPPPFNPTVGKALAPSFTIRCDPALYLVLDGVSDPGNVGTLIRSAVAAGGVRALILLPGSADVWSPKCLRSAMGATFHLPVMTMSGPFQKCLKEIEMSCNVKQENIYAATTLDAGEEEEAGRPSLAYYDVDWTQCSSSSSSDVAASALCLGKEGPGLSSEVREAVKSGCISSVYVPMDEESTDTTGAATATIVESLNAAVCGSIVMFEFARQRREWILRKSDEADSVR